MKLNNHKGFIHEQKFILEAIKQGFSISKPLFDQEPYDFIVTNSHKLNRVQIKSTDKFEESQNRYSVSVSKKNGKLYTKEDTDFIIVSANDNYYIIPVEELKSRSVRIYKKETRKLNNIETGKFMKFQNRWDLLK